MSYIHIWRGYSLPTRRYVTLTPSSLVNSILSNPSSDTLNSPDANAVYCVLSDTKNITKDGIKVQNNIVFTVTPAKINSAFITSVDLRIASSSTAGRTILAQNSMFGSAFLYGNFSASNLLQASTPTVSNLVS